jgi:methionine-rich copper-binding protein CopC
MRHVSMLVVLAATVTFCTAANAHPRLMSSDPTASSVRASSPKEIRLNFNERLVPQFSGVQIKDPQGRLIPTGKPASATDARQLIVPLSRPLNAGSYQIDWHATSVDTHRVQGHYTFKIKS